MAKKLSKKTKSWPLWSSLAFLLATLLFLASLYAAYQPKLLIAQIVVSGNKTVSEYDIRQLVNQTLAGKYWHLYPKRHALLFPREKIISELGRAFPRLSTIKLEQPNLQGLTLLVEERRGQFLWCQNEVCYFADQNGFVFAPAPEFSNPLFFELHSSSSAEILGHYALPAAEWQKLILARRELRGILAGSQLAEAEIYRADQAESRDWYFQVKMGQSDDNFWEIRLDLAQDFSVVLKTLALVLIDPDFIADYETHHGDLEYLDLRFAPKVFYRYNAQ